MGVWDRATELRAFAPSVQPGQASIYPPNLRKILVLSDTHMPSRARALPSRLVEALKEADLILHAGDLATAAVLDELRSYARVVAVRGNVDVPELRLPRRVIVPVGPFQIGMIHGDGTASTTFDRAAAAFANDPVQGVIFGHSHQPLLREENGRFYLNPGSPTDKRREPHYSFAWIHVEEDKLRPEIVYF